ncbi:MAG TPA: ferritin-like domain-containing protein [Gammaproteobacteria bacterium]|nr:ferritin-like domain-containing protein [Gammaproteobacteria bacterium]
MILARDCLAAERPVDKVAMTLRAASLWADGGGVPPAVDVPATALRPGRPARPVLVHHARLAPRKLGSPAGRAAFLHALAHIEFNAINLAWDAVCRFRGLPERFYLDWSQVAGEEALHFDMLCARLQELGHDYGDFPAHDGLWEMAEKTAHDVLVRMALVPRVLEARGLDVTPGMIARLEQVGDTRSVRILERILADEIGHVRIGTHWYRYLCRQRALDPVLTFGHLWREYRLGPVRKPINTTARQQAGFDAMEIDMLETMGGEAT